MGRAPGARADRVFFAALPDALAVEVLLVLTALVATGALLMTAASGTPDLKQDLQAIASTAVLFGHQSVGDNLLDGLRTLAEAQGVPLRIAQVSGAPEVRPGTFGHLYVAANGDPRRKLASFTAALAGGDPDLALVKFCYVDFDAGTDAPALFSEYEATLRALRAKHPRTTFVRVTVPLVADDDSLKALVKRLLGRTPGAVLSNARREEFNALLRGAAVGEPLFDLARLESTDSSGQPVVARLDGKEIPMLAHEYTDDGGHLNGQGSLRAALGLVRALGDALAVRARAGAAGSAAGR